MTTSLNFKQLKIEPYETLKKGKCNPKVSKRKEIKIRADTNSQKPTKLRADIENMQLKSELKGDTRDVS